MDKGRWREASGEDSRCRYQEAILQLQLQAATRILLVHLSVPTVIDLFSHGIHFFSPKYIPTV